MKIPRNMTSGEGESDTRRDSGIGDFESCKKKIPG